MRTRFPIYAKVLLWFFVNLAVLAAAAWLLIRGQFKFSVFGSGVAQDRVERVARSIAGELSEAPRTGWDAILQRHSAALGVEIFCYDDFGRRLAGSTAAIPPEVHGRIVGPRRPGPPGPRRPVPPRRGDGPPPRDDPREFAGSEFGDQPPGPRGERPLPLGPEARRPDALTDDGRILVQTHAPERYWVIIRQPLKMDGAQLMGAIITASTSATGNGLYFDSKPFLMAAAAVLILSGLIWFPFVRSLTRSVGQMRDAAADLARGKFDTRVSESRGDELGQLGAEINRMAQRLAGYVHGQKRFLGDVAHELCAPTARLQMALSILEQRATPADRERLADVREEAEHMAGLVNELLQFSRADLGGKKIQPAVVALRDIADKAIRREAADTSRIHLDIPPDLRARADADLLQRALANLLRNAIRYAGHAGPIRVIGDAGNNTVHLRIADSGPGVPPDALPKIFDPLYRVDESRTQESGGIGLGLAIVKTCVEACEGTVTARNLEPQGLEVTITLPAA